jgi:hypothetical protein
MPGLLGTAEYPVDRHTAALRAEQRVRVIFEQLGPEASKLYQLPLLFSATSISFEMTISPRASKRRRGFFRPCPNSLDTGRALDDNY